MKNYKKIIDFSSVSVENLTDINSYAFEGYSYSIETIEGKRMIILRSNQLPEMWNLTGSRFSKKEKCKRMYFDMLNIVNIPTYFQISEQVYDQLEYEYFIPKVVRMRPLSNELGEEMCAETINCPNPNIGYNIPIYQHFGLDDCKKPEDFFQFVDEKKTISFLNKYGIPIDSESVQFGMFIDPETSDNIEIIGKDLVDVECHPDVYLYDYFHFCSTALALYSYAKLFEAIFLNLGDEQKFGRIIAAYGIYFKFEGCVHPSLHCNFTSKLHPVLYHESTLRHDHFKHTIFFKLEPSLNEYLKKFSLSIIGQTIQIAAEDHFNLPFYYLSLIICANSKPTDREKLKKCINPECGAIFLVENGHEKYCPHCIPSTIRSRDPKEKEKRRQRIERQKKAGEFDGEH